MQGSPESVETRDTSDGAAQNAGGLLAVHSVLAPKDSPSDPAHIAEITRGGRRQGNA
jgi:hypothetical protein